MNKGESDLGIFFINMFSKSGNYLSEKSRKYFSEDREIDLKSIGKWRLRVTNFVCKCAVVVKFTELQSVELKKKEFCSPEKMTKILPQC